ncbi:hypothetical protein Rhow_008085 [Rhodococcus wratislaviensis]|uniref:Uncharacterized protein n=1 Tax=Rhodococcus wratislaviensis TaxID=44752 RepID=A0A402CJM8_RHOWR|nr:hypothetical protein [Rhodococcus wratislaviensis]GCE43787.1 hypothetical protein Rhow_008085 [Rhodococcus wratislaviensis]
MTTAARSFDFEPARNAGRSARLRYGARLSDAAIMFGAVSIASFWTFGFGIILGAVALVAGALAVWHPDVADHESTSFEALLGMLAGVFGIAAGLIFLVSAWPNL